MQIQGKGTHRSNAGLKSWYLMGVGHLLCHLQLQAALVSWPENFASTNMQQPAHPSSSGSLGPVRTRTGAGTRSNAVGSPLFSRAALPRRGGTGHGRLVAGGLGPEPSCGERAGETCRWLQEVSPAGALSPPLLRCQRLFQLSLEPLSLGYDRPAAVLEGSVAVPAGAKLSGPG